MWVALFTIAATLFVITLAAAAYLTAERRRLKRDREQLQGELTVSETQNQSLKTEIAGLQTDIAVARTKLDGLDDKFQSLASNVFNRVLDQSDGQRKEAIQALVNPIQNKLNDYNRMIAQIEEARNQDYGSLRQQVESMITDQRSLRHETANLVKALRRPEVRGRWGEMQLRRVAELAGMIENCDFTEQDSVKTDDGILRPDMVVRLSSNRIIVVDAKTPIDAFISSVECTNDGERDEHLKRHASQIETRVKDLSDRNYAAQFDRTPDFVVLFIPGESFLHAAMQIKPKLFEWAWEKRVAIVSPNTLIALLRTASLGWQEQQLAENARRIGEEGKKLHERIATVVEHIDKLGTSLEKAVRSYNEFVGSFENRVVVTARKFKELGADSAKELPAEGEIKPIEAQPRQLKTAHSETAIETT